MQGLLADESVPADVKRALNAMHQSTANVLGSDGHRRLLHREGIAYTLRFGPPLVFATPNLADGKSPLLLIVQDEEFRMHDECQTSTRIWPNDLQRTPWARQLYSIS